MYRRADFIGESGLLVHLDIVSLLPQRNGSRKPTDSSSDDYHLQFAWSGAICPIRTIRGGIVDVGRHVGAAPVSEEISVPVARGSREMKALTTIR